MSVTHLDVLLCVGNHCVCLMLACRKYNNDHLMKKLRLSGRLLKFYLGISGGMTPEGLVQKLPHLAPPSHVGRLEVCGTVLGHRCGSKPLSISPTNQNTSVTGSENNS